MGVQRYEDNIWTIVVNFNPASVAANTTAEQDITIQGVQVGDVVEAVNKPSLNAGLGIVNSRVKAANTVSLTFSNNTGSPIDAPAEDYTIVIFRPEKKFTAVT